MEKRTPHHSLARMQELIRQGSWRVTMQASKTAIQDFNIKSEEELAPWILAIRRGNFYKSMTTFADARIWQDVYHAQVRGCPAYIKLQLADDKTVVISFKAL